MRACPHCHLLLTAAETTCPRDGERGAEVELAPVPAEVAAKFRGVEPFGRGATGSLYRAAAATGGATGVLKVMPVADASERGRLKRELRKHAKLVNNSLVRILDGGEIGALLWLWRDLAPGDSLAVKLRRDGKLALPEALAIVAQVASALDELHRAGLLHRDVKPGHVILEPRAEGVPLARVIDAGIAARLATGAALEPLGSANTIAPEQIEGKLVSFRSDLYSLGCVLHEMLTGAPPFSGATDEVLRAHREDPPPPLPADVPAPVVALVGALLAKDPRARPFSAQQVRRTIEPFLPAGTPPARSATQTSAGDVAAPSAKRTMLGAGPPAAAAGVRVVGGRVSVFGDEGEGETEELGEGDLRPSVPPPVPGAALPGATTQEIDVADIALVTGETFAPRGGAAHVVPEVDTTESQVTDVAQAAMPDAEEAVLAPDAPDASPRLDAPNAEPPGPPEPPRLSRPSVDFDVESLFSDEHAPVPEPEPLPDFVPSTRGRPAPEPPPIPEIEPAAGAPARGRTLWIGSAIGAFVVIVVVVALWGGGPPEEPPTAKTGAHLPAAAGPDDGQSAGASAPHRVDENPRAGHPGHASQVGDRAQQAQPSQVGDDPGEPSEGSLGEQPGGNPTEPSPVDGTGGAASPDSAEPGDAVPGVAVAGPGSAGGTGAAEVVPERARASSVQATPGSARGSLDDRRARAEAYKAEARSHYQAGRYPQAAQAYERAARQMPSDSGAYAGLGASLLAAGQPDDAIQAYQRAAQISPSSSGFHAALARAYEQKGDLDRARAAYRRSLQLNPQNQAASRGLARLGGAE